MKRLIRNAFSERPIEGVSVATPAEPRGEKQLFFCANFGR